MSRHSLPLRSQVSFGICFLVIAILSLSFVPGISHAASSDSEQRGFVDSIGAMVYGFAWPTAVYERVSFGSARETSAGLELSFRVHGKSAFGGGALWTDVILLISRGEIRDLRWGANNAILAQPGETIKALGEVLMELTNEYQSSSGASGASNSQGVANSSQVLSNQLAQKRADMRMRGFSETHDVFTSNLRAGERKNLTMTLAAGRTYIISGACDQDCRDLDLRLYDSNGRLLSSDEAGDDRPQVSVTPTRTAEFNLQVVMAHCSRAPCYYGTQVFGR